MSYLISFLLFGLLFVVIPFGISPFETPKVIIGEFLIVLIIVLSLLKKKTLSFNSIQRFVPHILIIFLIVISLVTHFTPMSLWGNQFRMQGVFLLLLLLGLSMVSSQVIAWIPSVKVVTCFLFIQVVCAFFIGGNSERAIGTLGEPNALAAAVLFLVPFVLSTNKKEKRKWWLVIVGLLCSLLIILMSGSRSGLIGLGIEGLFFILSQKLSMRKSISICLVILLLSWALPFLNKDQLYENRADIWITAVQAASTHPIVGWGFGNTEHALLVTIKTVKNNLRGYYVDSSHNLFLDWRIQGGVVGFGLIMWLTGQAGMVFVKQQDQQKMMLLLGLVTALTFNPASIVSLIQFWWLLGQGIYSHT